MLIINGVFSVMISATNRSCDDSVQDSPELNFVILVVIKLRLRICIYSLYVILTRYH